MPVLLRDMTPQILFKILVECRVLSYPNDLTIEDVLRIMQEGIATTRALPLFYYLNACVRLANALIDEHDWVLYYTLVDSWQGLRNAHIQEAAVIYAEIEEGSALDRQVNDIQHTVEINGIVYTVSGVISRRENEYVLFNISPVFLMDSAIWSATTATSQSIISFQQAWSFITGVPDIALLRNDSTYHGYIPCALILINREMMTEVD